MADTLRLDKATLVANARREMHAHLTPLDATVRQKVALACGILFSQGHDSGLAGQITARAGVKGTFYTQRLGLGFDEVSEANVLTVNEDLSVLDGEGMANPANRFHTWIYRVRPDVQCIVHTHPPHLCALGMIGRPLKVAQMDAYMLYDDVAHLAHWPGLPVGNSEGEMIARALGDRRAVLLAQHGVVAVGRSVEEACVVAVQCERAARLQLLAEAAGEIVDVDPVLAREAHDWILQDTRSHATFSYLARRFMRSLDTGARAVYGQLALA